MNSAPSIIPRPTRLSTNPTGHTINSEVEQPEDAPKNAESLPGLASIGELRNPSETSGPPPITLSSLIPHRTISAPPVSGKDSSIYSQYYPTETAFQQLHGSPPPAATTATTTTHFSTIQEPTSTSASPSNPTYLRLPSSQPQFTDGQYQRHHSQQHDYFMPTVAGPYHEDEYGAFGVPRYGSAQSGGMTTLTTEENFCSNFVCCGVYLSDLHALLQHYEDVHVKIEDDDEDEEHSGVIDVGIEEYPNGGGSENMARSGLVNNMSNNTISSLVPEFELTKATADSTSNQHRSTTTSVDNSAKTIGGYSVSSLIPPLHKRRKVLAFGGIEPCDYSSTGRGVSAFDTTVLRTVSRDCAEAKNNSHSAMSTFLPSGNRSSTSENCSNPSKNLASNTHSTFHSDSQISQLPRRPKSVPNLLAAAAASSTLKASLPPALAQNDSQFKLIYSILSSTLDSNNGSSSSVMPPNREFSHTPSAAAALMSIDAQIQQQMQRNAVSAGLSTLGNAVSGISYLSSASPGSINNNGNNGIGSGVGMEEESFEKSADRPYMCPISGCGKTYKNPNGLKYHALHGHDAASEAVEKPHKCPIITCGKRYKNPNGLKYHLSHAHQSKSSNAASFLSNSTSGAIKISNSSNMIGLAKVDDASIMGKGDSIKMSSSITIPPSLKYTTLPPPPVSSSQDSTFGISASKSFTEPAISNRNGISTSHDGNSLKLNQPHQSHHAKPSVGNNSMPRPHQALHSYTSKTLSSPVPFRKV